MKHYFYVAKWNDVDSDDPHLLHVTSGVMRVSDISPGAVHDKIRATVAEENNVHHTNVYIENLARLL